MATPAPSLSGNQREQRKLRCRRALATWLTLWGLALGGGAAQCAAQTFTIFDVPGSTNTIPRSINASGAITGYYNSSSYLVDHGFLRDPDGTITSFDPPDSISTFTPMTINASGAITGSYSSGFRHGFLRDPDGTFTSFDPPGSISTFTPMTINASGAITGSYSSGFRHGFLRDPDGTFTSFDPSRDIGDTLPRTTTAIAR